MKIMEQFTRTFKFKDLLPDFDSFIYNYRKYAPDDDLNEETAPIRNMEVAYNLLFNKYCQSSVAFDMQSDFYRNFYLIFWDEFQNFSHKLDLIKFMRSIPVNDLLTEYETITNVANNNNEIVNSPLSEVIPYISTQSSSTSKINKINAIVRALQSYRSNEGKYFVNKFKELFVSFFTDYGIYYNRGE